jgi:hypothetical protein
LPLNTLGRYTGGEEVQLHSCLALAPDGAQWSASGPATLPWEEGSAPTELEAGWAPEQAFTFWFRLHRLRLIKY